MIKSQVKRISIAGITALMMLVSLIMPIDGIYAYADEINEPAPATEDAAVQETPEKTEQLNGWVSKDGNKKYYVDGVAVHGLKTIDGKKYYFKDNGNLAKGFVHIGNKLYYFKQKSGAAMTKKGWVKIKGNLRYGLGNGQVAVGHKKIGKTHYFFSYESGKKAKKGFHKSKSGNRYYCKGSGKLATGWTAVGNRAYYFSKSSARQKKNTRIGYLKIPKKGYLGKSYAQGIRVLNKEGWNLRAAYNYSSTKLKYYGKGMRKPTSEDYARFGFENKKGNCYVMAATFYIMAKLLKYDVHQVQGYVGPTCAHSWTTINHNGSSYVYDPQFRNRTGRSGWKFKYGKRGTWRYNRYKNMN